MKRHDMIFVLFLATAFAPFAQGSRVLITTLNCYAFFGGNETKMQLGQPQTSQDYWHKAGNLVGLWPTNAPLFVALQEIGGAREAGYLAKFASARYKHSFQPIFAGTKDNYTEEAVGAVLDLGQGWQIAGKPGRVSDLDTNLSKHLVVELTNSSAHAALEFCIVHLRRGVGKYGLMEQHDQNAALEKWVAGRLEKNPRENLIVLGDFNESKPVGAATQSLWPLVQTNAPLHDPFALLSGQKIRTHANGNAYDRILLSGALMDGASGLKFENISVREHPYGKGTNRYWFTDHFPVTLALDYSAKK
jgi:endonuclease/exonuclease/phosphatase family metal-dependent hydrolase